MKIGIVTDSLACLSETQIMENNIKVVNLTLHCNDNHYIENVEIDNKLFYELQDAGNKLTSSQPAPSDFEAAYNELKAEGYTDILSIHPANVISGTINSARLASEMVEGVNVTCFEGMCASFEEKMFIDVSLKMIRAGKTLTDIFNHLINIRTKSKNYVVIEDLMVLANAGRISKSIASIGNLVRLKPMIRLDDNGFDLIHKYRTNKNIINQIIVEIEEHYKLHGKLLVYITSVFRDDLVNKIKDTIEALDLDVKIVLCEMIGPVLSLNFGKPAFGISWTAVE